MAVEGASALLGSIVVAGFSIRDLIDKWYRVSQELKDFDGKLELLRMEQQTWEAQIHKLGLAEDQGLMDLFGKALSNLQEEKTKLEFKWLKGGGCLSKLKWSCFPLELQKRVDKVTGIFNEVLQSLKNQIEIEAQLQKRILNRAPSLECRPDSRYIRLERTNKKVMAALQNSDGPSVTLLHGGPGTGKSSLATDVAVQFQQDIDKRRALFRENKGQVPNSSPMFDQVIFLECGPQMNPQSKHSELREKLGWSIHGDGGALAESSSIAESNLTVTKTLSSLLKDRKLLVILDDMWNSGSEFLQKLMDLGGKSVKWFITSQLEGLCDNLNCDFIPISMEVLTIEDARRILAVHIKLPEIVISEVKDFMDTIIHKVNGKPLALTCISPAIDKNRYNQKREWIQLEKGLSDLLGSMPVKRLQSREYGRSYWEAVQVGFDLLSRPQQNLLILMHMCKGPSVREGIIEYLFDHTSDKYQNFSLARRELQERGHIKMLFDVSDDFKAGESMCSWSVHSLLKEFIKRKYFLTEEGGKLESSKVLSKRGIVCGNQIGCQIEANIVSAMIVLYFESEHSEELIHKYAIQMDLQTDKSQYTLQATHSRGHVIEPLAQLLIWNEDADWTSTLHSATQEVFLKYSRSGKFDQDGTSILLGPTVSNVYMLTALSRYREIEPNSFFGQTVVSSLLQSLETQCIYVVSGDPSGTSSLPVHSPLIKVAYLLGFQLRMGGCKTDDQDKRRLSSIVEQLSMGFTKPVPYDLQECSLEALAYLVGHNDYISKKMVSIPGVLQDLVRAIRDDHCEVSQRLSAFAIRNLARNSKYIRLKTMSWHGTLQGLVAGVKKEEDEMLQIYCTQALSNLAVDSSRIVLEIVNCGGALEALANGLKKENDWLAMHSVQALVNLAKCSDEVKRKIVRLTGTLDYFVSVVTRPYSDGEATNTGMILESVEALWMLASGGDSIRAEMLECCPGILDVLTDVFTTLCTGEPNKLENDRGLIIRKIMSVLMLLNPGRAKEMHLDSGYAYWGRGNGMVQLCHYHEAVQDFDTCAAILHRSLPQHATFTQFLRYRCCAKARISDLQGAMADANLLVEISRTPAALQERGIIKQMMGDLKGALADLDESLCLNSDDFEVLKHRGFVKYLLHDVEGAQVDAQLALQVRQDYGDCIDYSAVCAKTMLGFVIIRYLNFEL